MLSVNAVLGLSYVISSYWIWAEVDKWSKWNIASIWTPISIIPYRIPNTAQVQMPILPLWNFPFMLFCVILAVNLYFILRLQKTKQTKQTPSME